MSWRIIATVLVIVFSIVLLQSALAGPLMETSERLNESGDYSDNGHFDGNQIISDMPGHWFNMGLVAIFGIMAWGAWRVIREELTRGRL